MNELARFRLRIRTLLTFSSLGTIQSISLSLFVSGSLLPEFNSGRRTVGCRMGCTRLSSLVLRGCKDDVSYKFSELVDDSAVEGPAASILGDIGGTIRWEGLDRSGWTVPDVSSPKAWTGAVTSGSD